jgi:hypothetical protein
MTNKVSVNKLVDFIRSNNLKTRINEKSVVWNNWLAIPVDGYLDFGLEPLPFSELNSIEIQTYYIKEIGIRVPSQKISVFKELVELLKTITSIKFVTLDNNNIIKVIFTSPTDSRL